MLLPILCLTFALGYFAGVAFMLYTRDHPSDCVCSDCKGLALFADGFQEHNVVAEAEQAAYVASRPAHGSLGHWESPLSASDEFLLNGLVLNHASAFDATPCLVASNPCQAVRDGGSCDCIPF